MRKKICMILISSFVLVVGCSSSEGVVHNTTEVKAEFEENYEEVSVPEPQEYSAAIEDTQRPVISVEKFSNGERIGDIFKKGEISQAKNMSYDNLKSALDIYMLINPIDPIFTDYAIEERMEPYGLFYVFILQLNDEDINVDDNSFESIWGALSVDEMSFEMIDGIKIVIADENGEINRLITMTKK